jgi:hypothetical protein
MREGSGPIWWTARAARCIPGGGQDVQEHLLRRLRDRVATGKTQVTYKGHPLYYFYDDD